MAGSLRIRKNAAKSVDKDMHRRFLPLLAVLLAGACAARQSTAASPTSSLSAALPEVSAERRKAALFYSDLGPDTVDVSAYPSDKKLEYAVYARACARCHTLARSINAPYVNRAWWEFYVASMRIRAKFHGEPLTKQEVRSILDFLEYDSNERKVSRAAEFETMRIELKRHFETVLDERMDVLQKQHQPRLTP